MEFLRSFILDFWENFWQDFDDSTRSQSHHVSIGIILVMAVLTWNMTWSENHASLFSAINLGIHEIGHMVFRFGGEFIGMLGGSIFQCGGPFFAAVGLMQARDYRGIPFCGTWLASNIYEVGVYVGDARLQALHLVSPVTSHPIHDWHFILGKLKLLKWDTTFAACLEMTAFSVALLALYLGFIMLQRIRNRAQGIVS
ncbi:MAG: hypothetical protein WA705_21690 [Candidatus Ozemobacteraceae bacterium]